MQPFKAWYERRLSNPELIILLMTITLIGVLMLFMGHLITPMVVSIIIAYLLAWPVRQLIKCRFPPLMAVSTVWLLTISVVVFAGLRFFPLVWHQLVSLAYAAPIMVTKAQALVMHLPKKYPDLITHKQILDLISKIQIESAHFGRTILSALISSIPDLIEFVIYFVLVPLLVFFFLKDYEEICGWFSRYIPKNRKLLTQVWREIDQQIGHYIRGKAVEILIVGTLSTAVFAALGLDYALLLGTLMGLSTLIPFVGAVLITIPVVIVGLTQWGMNSDFWYVIIAHSIILILDANVLVPVMFSEKLKLHPVAIILAILVFGGFFGFWGIFFAIPLATVVKAVLNAWPDV